MRWYEVDCVVFQRYIVSIVCNYETMSIFSHIHCNRACPTSPLPQSVQSPIILLSKSMHVVLLIRSLFYTFCLSLPLFPHGLPVKVPTAYTTFFESSTTRHAIPNALCLASKKSDSAVGKDATSSSGIASALYPRGSGITPCPSAGCSEIFNPLFDLSCSPVKVLGPPEPAPEASPLISAPKSDRSVSVLPRSRVSGGVIDLKAICGGLSPSMNR